jgi:hypothetical protein
VIPVVVLRADAEVVVEEFIAIAELPAEREI